MPAIPDNRTIALDVLAALSSGNADGVRELMAPDAVWWVPGVDTFDRETLLANLAATMDNVGSAALEIVGTTAEGERVAIEARGNFVFRDGTVYANTYHFLFVIRDGKVVKGHEYLDTAYLARTFAAA